MKKTYIIPESLVIDIHFNHSLLSGSPIGQISNDNNDEIKNSDGFGSRDAGFDFFDDDED